MATYLPHSLSKPLAPVLPYPDRVAGNINGSYRRLRRRRWRRRSPVTVRCSSTESVVASLTRSAETELKYVVSEHGWGVRRVAKEDQEEIRKVSLVQAEAFHTPLALFDHFFFLFFQAEVLSGLLYKLKNSAADRYGCLVAEATSESEESESGRGIVGVVDVTAMRDDSVLRHFPDVHEYLYVSGLAVSKSMRRRKVGSTLLKACDVVCFLWGFKLLALRAYEDDAAARNLYSNAGYSVVAVDPPWTSTWIGRKRRVLMIKPLR